MGKIISFDTFCYRRELKAMEKELSEKQVALKKKQVLRDQSIARLIGYAEKHCNWEKKDDIPVDND